VLDATTGTKLVRAAEGAVTAYSWQIAHAEHSRLFGWGTVHPDHRGRAIGSLLIDLAEQRAREHRAAALPQRDVEFEVGTVAPDDGVRSILEARGFRNVRQFWRMEIDLDASMSRRGDQPDGVTIRGFQRQSDDRAVHAAITESFRGQWGFVARPFDEWATHRLDDPEHDPSVWFVAEDGGEIVGALVGAVQGDLGWVHTLAVRQPWRGRGVATSLLGHAFAAFAGKGLHTAALGVDSQNETGATRLYSRVGMHVTHHYNTYRKILPERAS